MFYSRFTRAVYDGDSLIITKFKAKKLQNNDIFIVIWGMMSEIKVNKYKYKNKEKQRILK